MQWLIKTAQGFFRVNSCGEDSFSDDMARTVALELKQVCRAVIGMLSPEPHAGDCTQNDIELVFPKMLSHGQQTMMRKSSLAKRIPQAEGWCEAVRGSDQWFAFLASHIKAAEGVAAYCDDYVRMKQALQDGCDTNAIKESIEKNNIPDVGARLQAGRALVQQYAEQRQKWKGAFKPGGLDKVDDMAKGFLRFWLNGLPDPETASERIDYIGELNDIKCLSEICSCQSVQSQASAKLIEMHEHDVSESLGALMSGVFNRATVTQFLETLRTSEHATFKKDGKKLLDSYYKVVDALVQEVETTAVTAMSCQPFIEAADTLLQQRSVQAASVRPIVDLEHEMDSFDKLLKEVVSLQDAKDKLDKADAEGSDVALTMLYRTSKAARKVLLSSESEIKIADAKMASFYQRLHSKCSELMDGAPGEAADIGITKVISQKATSTLERGLANMVDNLLPEVAKWMGGSSTAHESWSDGLTQKNKIESYIKAAKDYLFEANIDELEPAHTNLWEACMNS